MEDTKQNKEYQKFMDSVEAGKGIDWFKCINRIWQVRKNICISAGIGAILGVLVAIGIPKLYTVSVSLAPEMGDTKMGVGLANMAASFLGGRTPSGGGEAVNALLAPEILKSTPFLLELADAKIQPTGDGDTLTLATYITNESKPWWGVILGFPSKVIGGMRSLFTAKNEVKLDAESVPSRIVTLTGEQISCFSKLRTNISTMVDKKTSIIRINVALQNPVVAAALADSIVNKLQTYIVNYRSSKATEDLHYWEKLFVESKEKFNEAQVAYATYMDNNSHIILQRSLIEREQLNNEMNIAYQVFSQVTQHYQMAQAKVQELKPAFTIVEPPVVPIRPSSISKVFVLILVIGGSVFFYLIWELFFKGVWNTCKNKIITY